MKIQIKWPKMKSQPKWKEKMFSTGVAAKRQTKANCTNENRFDKQKNKNVFLAGPYNNNIDCYCIGTEKEFVDLVKDYFLIKDSGYSCHKLFGRRINEWIVCGEN